MTKETNTLHTSRRHLLKKGAALPLAGACSAIAIGAGSSGAASRKENAMFDDLAPAASLQSNDAQLRALLNEWEPLAQAYRRTCDAEDAAQEGYYAAIYKAAPRFHDALKAVHIRQAVQKIWDESFEQNPEIAGKFPYRRLTDEQRRQMIEENIAEYMEPGEEPDSFLQRCNDEVQKEIRSKNDARAHFRLDELSEELREIVRGEREIGERMAVIAADTMQGVGMKLTVAQSISIVPLALSIMRDIRRFANLPPAPEDVEDPFIHAFG